MQSNVIIEKKRKNILAIYWRIFFSGTISAILVKCKQSDVEAIFHTDTAQDIANKNNTGVILFAIKVICDIFSLIYKSILLKKVE